MSDLCSEKAVADILYEEIKIKLKEILSTLDGQDARYFDSFYKSLLQDQEKISKACGLPRSVIMQIAFLIQKKDFIAAAKELERQKFKYINQERCRERSQEELRQKEHLKKNEEEREAEKEREDEELDLEEDLNKAKTLAKLYELKQKGNGKKILKDMLLSVISARMDPKQRAGETAKSNVLHAQNFGRGAMLTIGMLIKAGAIKASAMHKLESLGLGKNSVVSVDKVRNFISGKANGLFDLVKGDFLRSGSLTKIPKKQDAIGMLSEFNSSMSIFDKNLETKGKQSSIKPDSTPFVEQVTGHGPSL